MDGRPKRFGFATCRLTVPEQARGGAKDPAAEASMLALAKALLAQSALRQSMFDGLFRQPSWDMLLCLYVARHEQAELTEKALCASSGEAFSTAHRWLRQMEQNGLVTRRTAGHDARNIVVEITDEAISAVEGLLRELAAGIHSGDCGAERH